MYSSCDFVPRGLTLIVDRVSQQVDFLVTDGRIVLPGGQQLDGWMAVQDGRIVSLGETGPPNSRALLDCEGNLVMPGLIDIHVHFRDPDFTDKEDFTSGSAAAACGGVTTVVDMPNDEMPVFSPAQVQRKLDRIEGRSHVDFGLYAQLGDSSAFVRELTELGVVGMKWYMGYESNSSSRVSRAAIHDALAAAAAAGMLVGVHAEASGWVADFADRERAGGRTDAAAHPESRRPFIEALGVAEAMIAVRDAGARLHIHHLTSSEAFQTALALRDDAAAPVTLETCPHYLLLNDEHVRQLGTLTRVNPPLRSAEDNAALWEAIAAGEIDCVASDHAPHMVSAKAAPSIWEADSGFLGTETMFPLLFHEVCEGRISVDRFCELTATRPAEIARLPGKGRLLPGFDADFVVVDTAGSTTIAAASLHSKQRITPFEGWTRRGHIARVYLRGRPIACDGQVVGPAGGRYVRASRNRIQEAFGAG